MSKIKANPTSFSAEKLKRGDSIVTWFTDMISSATDANFTNGDQKLQFIWHMLDTELRSRLPTLKDTHTVQTCLLELRKAEHPLRDAFVAQEKQILSSYLTTRQYVLFNRYNPGITRYQPSFQKPFLSKQPQHNAENSLDKQLAGPSTIRSAVDKKPGAFVGDTVPVQPDQPKCLPSYETYDKAMSSVNKARNESYRTSQRSPCSICGGYHYNSMCRRRHEWTPRVYFVGKDAEIPIYHVEPIGVHDYDSYHQEFVNAFFANGHWFNNFYQFFKAYEDEQCSDVVHCELIATPVSSLDCSGNMPSVQIASKNPRGIRVTKRSIFRLARVAALASRSSP
ncbi:hypothetical protein EDC01DRAFT_636476 [Geopyxis carbonaria]|nr:hypothetical protein EDC01DRAFT_636476 [Geopyxis carbonaria]